MLAETVRRAAEHIEAAHRRALQSVHALMAAHRVLEERYYAALQRCDRDTVADLTASIAHVRRLVQRLMVAAQLLSMADDAAYEVYSGDPSRLPRLVAALRLALERLAGLDAGAAAEVYTALARLADAGRLPEPEGPGRELLLEEAIGRAEQWTRQAFRPLQPMPEKCRGGGG